MRHSLLLEYILKANINLNKIQIFMEEPDSEDDDFYTIKNQWDKIWGLNGELIIKGKKIFHHTDIIMIYLTARRNLTLGGKQSHKTRRKTNHKKTYRKLQKKLKITKKPKRRKRTKGYKRK